MAGFRPAMATSPTPMNAGREGLGNRQLKIEPTILHFEGGERGNAFLLPHSLCMSACNCQFAAASVTKRHRKVSGGAP